MVTQNFICIYDIYMSNFCLNHTLQIHQHFKFPPRVMDFVGVCFLPISKRAEDLRPGNIISKSRDKSLQFWAWCQPNKPNANGPITSHHPLSHWPRLLHKVNGQRVCWSNHGCPCTAWQVQFTTLLKVFSLFRRWEHVRWIKSSHALDTGTIGWSWRSNAADRLLTRRNRLQSRIWKESL